ncbi:hypothetical protein TNIN_26321 [Trichonephila inaurata madagascariensis]|uniref:Uncharacterized protein n=1 Tax=Trichonephila inaurata madagascariensis TaxID=2747483 RepID=A0A8X6ML91_9ARAC|nr:hypothetical protein TNIN_26321 [Trichonephila inaurata madagascariensis]
MVEKDREAKTFSPWMHWASLNHTARYFYLVRMDVYVKCCGGQGTINRCRMDINGSTYFLFPIWRGALRAINSHHDSPLASYVGTNHKEPFGISQGPRASEAHKAKHFAVETSRASLKKSDVCFC